MEDLRDKKKIVIEENLTSNSNKISGIFLKNIFTKKLIKKLFIYFFISLSIILLLKFPFEIGHFIGKWIHDLIKGLIIEFK